VAFDACADQRFPASWSASRYYIVSGADLPLFVDAIPFEHSGTDDPDDFSETMTGILRTKV